MKRKMKKMVFILIAITLMLTAIAPVGVYANGWVDKSRADSIYGNSGESHVPENNEEAGGMNLVEKYIIGFYENVGDSILRFLDGGTVPLSIDGVVLGRLASNVDVAYVRFELEEGNPWGVIGAIIYRTVAGAFIGFFLIIFLWSLVKFLVRSNSARERAEIKEFFFRFSVCFMVVFIGYYLIDWLIFFSDILNYGIQNHIAEGIGCDTGSAASIVGIFRDNMVQNGGFFNTILFMASVFAGLFFITNYVGTAIVQTGLFGVVPFVSLKSTVNKQAFSVWMTSFIPNVFIPCIDGALLLMPNAFYNVIYAASGEQAANSISVRFIQLFMIWAVIPSRNAIIRSVGGAQAAQSNGLRGLATMALMAARMFGRGAGNSLRNKVGNTSSSERDSGTISDRENRQDALAQSETFTEANRMTTAGMSDVDDILSDNERGAKSRLSSSVSDNETVEDTADETAMDEFLNEERGFSGGAEDSDFMKYENTSFDGGDDEERLLTMPADEINSGMNDVEIDDGNEIIPEAIQGTDFEQGIKHEERPFAGEDDTENVPSMPMDEIGREMDEIRKDSGNDIMSENEFEKYESVQDLPDESSLHGYKNIPNMQSDFAQTLEGADLDRYANLNALDALKDEFNSNNLRMSEINEQMASDAGTVKSIHSENAHLSSINEAAQENNAALNHDIVSLQARNGDIDKELTTLRSTENSTANSQIQSLEEEKLANNAAIQSKSAAVARNTALIERNSATIASNGDRLANIDTRQQAYHAEIAGLQTRNQKVQSGIENCNSREKQYASNYANAGMSDKSYSDARAFRIDKQAQQNVVKQLNYKNFDRGDFEQYLTPEQRVKLYQERAVKGTMKKAAVDTGKAVATVAAGTVGATAMMYGGPSAMLGGAIATNMIGGKAVEGVAGVGKAGVEFGKEKWNKNGKPKVEKTIAEIKQKRMSQQNRSQYRQHKPAMGEKKSQTSNNAGMDTFEKELREDYRKDVEAMNKAFEQHRTDK